MNIIDKIRQEKPLVLNITNVVTMDFIANGLLSIGASPVMSQDKSEIEDLVNIAKSVVINIGTLNPEFIELSRHACHIANKLNKPVILDPVGVGASKYRTDAATAIINDYQISIIRGNASEIMALADSSTKTKGVDSIAESHSAVDSAKSLAKKYHATVVVNGKTDYIVDGELLEKIERGSAMMPYVTGTGCLLTAVIGAYNAVEADRFLAAKEATLHYCIAGEKAEQKATGPGSFLTHFVDALYE